MLFLCRILELDSGMVAICLFNEFRDFFFVYLPDRKYIDRAHGRQTRSDKLGDLINTTLMFLDIEAKTSLRLPSRFEAIHKFCVDIRPDFHT